MFPWSVAATCVAIVSLLTDEFQHRHRNTGGLGLRMGDMSLWGAAVSGAINNPLQKLSCVEIDAVARGG